jgi:hypothetical protein
VGFYADSIEISNSVIKKRVYSFDSLVSACKADFYHGVMVNPPNVNT